MCWRGHLSTLAFLTSHFGFMDAFFSTLIPPNSFISNQNNYKHQSNMDIYS